jgi:hypothetical protein
MRKRNRNSRGSALLISLMVMVGLSLLGLGFVVISQTESNISTNERNYVQVLSAAEAGARLVLEWFQDPVWANTQGLLPANTNAIKNVRQSLVAAVLYTGRYKEDGGLLFDKPYRPRSVNRFFGTATLPDVFINSTNSATFLATINNALFTDVNDGQITEIKVYAPPVVGGSINASGYWEGGTRYGLATIEVTASKLIGGKTVATRVVRMVISEWPFPGPQGPVQSNANISTGGNFGVHWGRMTSEGDMEVKLPWIGMPWMDSWTSIPFEYGYFQNGYSSTGKPLDVTNLCSQYDWLYKILDTVNATGPGTTAGIEDPWYTARAKGSIVDHSGTPRFPSTTFQPYKFTDPSQNVTTVPDKGFSNWFQIQNFSAGPGPCASRDQQLVIFPKIDYTFWKNLSQSASTTNSTVKYLRWVTGEEYTDGVSQKRFAEWLNTVNGAKPGFYFFDSANGLNPQGSAPAGTLAPDIQLNSGDDGHIFLMKGFIYLNAISFGTTGINGPDAYYNYPGEPFRDVGYLRVDPDSPTHTVNLDGTWDITGGGVYEFEPDGTTIKNEGQGSGEFESEDLNHNGMLDVFVVQRTVNVPGGGGSRTFWFPVPYTPGCIPGFNGVGSASCSEPHEPYLNLVYPQHTTTGLGEACCASSGRPNPVMPGWEDPTAVTRLMKTKNPAGAPVICPGTNSLICTSNSWDRDGPLTAEFGANSAPIMDGVLYNEGAFDTPGNANYFGSILINGNIRGTGTAEVWFDEYLVKGGWQDKFKELPRVFVTAHETEQ